MAASPTLMASLQAEVGRFSRPGQNAEPSFFSACAEYLQQPCQHGLTLWLVCRTQEGSCVLPTSTGQWVAMHHYLAKMTAQDIEDCRMWLADYYGTFLLSVRLKWSVNLDMILVQSHCCVPVQKLELLPLKGFLIPPSPLRPAIGIVSTSRSVSSVAKPLAPTVAPRSRTSTRRNVGDRS